MAKYHFNKPYQIVNWGRPLVIEFREWISAIIFFVGMVGVCNLFVDHFQWPIVMATVLCFILAYGIWPSKRKGQRRDDSRMADILEIFIELPIEMFLWVIRILGRLLGGKGNGVDIEL